jgi:hypothetical protein
MNTLSRRDAMKMAASGGVAALAATAVAASDPAQDKPKVNNEPSVEGTTIAQRYGARQLFAVVDWDGTLKRGLHAVSARSLSVGYYEVVFDRDVRHGAYVATSGGPGFAGVPAAAVATVMGRASDPHAVLVCVSGMNGGPIAAGFHLIVICPEDFA